MYELRQQPSQEIYEVRTARYRHEKFAFRTRPFVFDITKFRKYWFFGTSRFSEVPKIWLSKSRFRNFEVPKTPPKIALGVESEPFGGESEALWKESIGFWSRAIGKIDTENDAWTPWLEWYAWSTSISAFHLTILRACGAQNAPIFPVS